MSGWIPTIFMTGVEAFRQYMQGHPVVWLATGQIRRTGPLTGSACPSTPEHGGYAALALAFANMPAVPFDRTPL